MECIYVNKINLRDIKMKTVILSFLLLCSTVSFALIPATEARKQSMNGIVIKIENEVTEAINYGSFSTDVIITIGTPVISVNDIEKEITNRLKELGYEWKWSWNNDDPDHVRLTISW